MVDSMLQVHLAENADVVKITTRGAAMEVQISAAEANRKFSLLLRGVREGKSFVITSHGRPVARITQPDDAPLEASEARKILFDRLKSQPAVSVGSWNRDELYEDEL